MTRKAVVLLNDLNPSPGTILGTSLFGISCFFKALLNLKKLRKFNFIF